MTPSDAGFRPRRRLGGEGGPRQAGRLAAAALGMTTIGDVMTRTTKILAFMPLLLLAAQPALAAEPAGATRTGGFAGIQLRLSLDPGKRAAPTARLRLGLSHHRSDLRGSAQVRDGGAIELGLTRLGRPDLYVGGHSFADLRQRFRLAPAATVLVIAGGAAVGALAVNELTDDEMNRYQCFLPEKELCGTPPSGG